MYFNVESESWDDSMGAHHMKNNRNRNVQGVETSFAHNPDETDCDPANKNFNLDGSTIEANSSSVVVCDGFNGNVSSAFSRPNSNHCSSPPAASDAQQNTSSGLAVRNGNSKDSKQFQGKTSPVAVPRSNRSSHHRHESSSSASIGR